MIRCLKRSFFPVAPLHRIRLTDPALPEMVLFPKGGLDRLSLRDHTIGPSGAIDGLTPEVIVADRLYDFDRTLFGIEEMPPEQIHAHAHAVAQKIADTL